MRTGTTVRFRDRAEAGARLAPFLEEYRDSDPIICPLVRGGVVLGAKVARYLNAPMEPIFIRKIGHPLNPELAIGAVSDKGNVVMASYAHDVADQEWLAEQIQLKQADAVQRRQLYLGGRPSHSLTGTTAILMDDGIATGATMSLAITMVRNCHPRSVVIAVPVIDRDTASRLAPRVDRIVAVEVVDSPIGAVSLSYEYFPAVTDAEIITALGSVRM